MLTFNDLPFELREQILVHALHTAYPTGEFNAALNNPCHAKAMFITAKVRLGQRTLSKLKSTSREMYADAVIASRKWLDYEMLDLFEELEPIKSRLFEHAQRCRSPFEYIATVSGEDYHRFIWITQKEMNYLAKHQKRLNWIEHRTWERLRRKLPETGSFDGFCKSMNNAEEHVASRQSSEVAPAQPASTNLLRKRELIVCFGDKLVGIDDGCEPDAIGDAARWVQSRYLPYFGYGSSLTDWWRPYRRQTFVGAQSPESSAGAEGDVVENSE